MINGAERHFLSLSQNVPSTCAGDSSDFAKMDTRLEKDQMLVCNPRPGPERKPIANMKTHLRTSVYQTYWLFNVQSQLIHKGHHPKPRDDAESQYVCEYLEETIIAIHPSTWLVRLGWQHGLRLKWLSSSSHGWQANLDTMRTVPDDALIFELCQTGDLPGVQRLLSSCQASVRDVDSRGWSPLHVSLLSLRPGTPIRASFETN